MIGRYLFYFLAISQVTIIVNCDTRMAVADLSNENITGAIYFTETDNGLRLQGVLVGLSPGLYGFHVHELGDTTTCDATGAHFNPDLTTHGGQTHTVRHVGDLGNVQFLQENYAPVDFVDTLISLQGRNSILGRALVLHENEDDLGLGGHETSLTTGNAGARIACGVIGIYSPVDWNSGLSLLPSLSLLVIGLLFSMFK